MSFLSLWNRVCRRMPRRANRPFRGRFLPAFEALEDRTVPSTFTVTSTADSGMGSLRAEIAAADSGDKIVFGHAVLGQTIKLASQLTIDKSLDIEGPGAEQVTVSGNNVTRVFDIKGAVKVTLAGLTITNGLAVSTSPSLPGEGGGGIENEAGATLNLRDDTIANNTAYGVGGGLWNRIGATVSIKDVLFTGNKAFGSLNFNEPEEGFAAGDGTTEGGAIENDGTATVRDSCFTDNLAQGATGGAFDAAHGGAIEANGALTLSGSTFTGNKVRGGDGSAGGTGADGGAGGQAEAGAVAISGNLNTGDVSDCVFIGNQSIGGNGGAGGAGANGGNGGVGAAGALDQANGTITVARCTFIGNEATGGVGGTGGTGGNGGNGGIGRGGAFVHTVAGPNGASFHPLSNVSDVVMIGNEATGGAGGAGGLGGNGGNGGSGQGGGMRALLGTINVGHSLLFDNEAEGGAGGAAGAGGTGGNGGNGQGGGFLTAFGVTATLSDTALVLNEAEGGAGAAGGNGGNGQGGGIFNGGPSPFGTPDLTLKHCLVTLNEADGGAAGAGGSNGQGVGGGSYNNKGTFTADAATVIAHNHASTSNDNIFP